MSRSPIYLLLMAAVAVVVAGCQSPRQRPYNQPYGQSNPYQQPYYPQPPRSTPQPPIVRNDGDRIAPVTPPLQMPNGLVPRGGDEPTLPVPGGDQFPSPTSPPK